MILVYRVVLFVAGIFVLLLFYGSILEPSWLEITRHTVDAPVVSPLKIAHVTDQHMKRFGYPWWAGKISFRGPSLASAGFRKLRFGVVPSWGCLHVCQQRNWNFHTADSVLGPA